MFKCFHCANSSFDLLLRMKLKASLGRKVPTYVKCGLAEKKPKPTPKFIFFFFPPNSGSVKILILVSF